MRYWISMFFVCVVGYLAFFLPLSPLCDVTPSNENHKEKKNVVFVAVVLVTEKYH